MMYASRFMLIDVRHSRLAYQLTDDMDNLGTSAAGDIIMTGFNHPFKFETQYCADRMARESAHLSSSVHSTRLTFVFLTQLLAPPARTRHGFGWRTAAIH